MTPQWWSAGCLYSMTGTPSQVCEADGPSAGRNLRTLEPVGTGRGPAGAGISQLLITDAPPGQRSQALSGQPPRAGPCHTPLAPVPGENGASPAVRDGPCLPEVNH